MTIAGQGGPENILTVDVEDYFMVSAFSDSVPARAWDGFESRVEGSTRRLLDLFESHGVRATFFVLGYVARRHPSLVREIAGRGHEIGCHSDSHRLVYEMTPEEFREDTREAKRVLEDLFGGPVLGYRAPSYSITKKSSWAFDILAELGFLYDSSVFPIVHDRYGYREFGREERTVGSGPGVREIPLSTVRIAGANIPVAGGGYLRLFPYAFTAWAIRRLNRRENRAAVVYVHPWEIDTDQPRLRGRALSVFRHYVNIRRTEGRLERLLEAFRFGPFREVLGLPAA